jgi:hypothetical protein
MQVSEKFDRRAFLETTSDDTRDISTTNILPSSNINDFPATIHQLPSIRVRRQTLNTPAGSNWVPPWREACLKFEPGLGTQHDMLHKSRMRRFPSALLGHDTNADTADSC